MPEGASPSCTRRPFGSCIATCALLLACSEAKEAERVQVRVFTDGSGLVSATTDLGFDVEVSEARVVAEDLQFAIAGEAHASLWRRLAGSLIREAHAHPGHFQGGEVTGELPGHFVWRFAAGDSFEVGLATLLTGTYHSANFGLGRAAEQDVGSGDALFGHTALLSGRATRDDVTIKFDIAIDSPEGRQLVGAPFEATIQAGSSSALRVRLLTLDPLEHDTLFDSIDFAALDTDGDGALRIDEGATDAPTIEAYNFIRRAFQTHDQFDVKLQP
jgi:hypothetical protein